MGLASSLFLRFRPEKTEVEEEIVFDDEEETYCSSSMLSFTSAALRGSSK